MNVPEDNLNLTTISVISGAKLIYDFEFGTAHAVREPSSVYTSNECAFVHYEVLSDTYFILVYHK